MSTDNTPTNTFTINVVVDNNNDNDNDKIYELPNKKLKLDKDCCEKSIDKFEDNIKFEDDKFEYINEIKEINEIKDDYYIFKNLCLECGVDMGECNPRQYCGKTYCKNNIY